MLSLFCVLLVLLRDCADFVLAAIHCSNPMISCKCKYSLKKGKQRPPKQEDSSLLLARSSVFQNLYPSALSHKGTVGTVKQAA